MVLDRFIDHPLTDVAGSMVTALVEPDLRWGTREGFALNEAPWRVPWAR